MKTTTQCGRCDAKIDVEEGMMIATCLSPVDKKKELRAHSLAVNPNVPAGVAILDHIERKPLAARSS